MHLSRGVVGILANILDGALSNNFYRLLAVNYVAKLSILDVCKNPGYISILAYCCYW